MRYPTLKAAVDAKSELRIVHVSACLLCLSVYRQPIHNLAISLHADQVPEVLQRYSCIDLVSMALRLLRTLCDCSNITGYPESIALVISSKTVHLGDHSFFSCFEQLAAKPMRVAPVAGKRSQDERREAE
jgi:hypothetical protein